MKARQLSSHSTSKRNTPSQLHMQHAIQSNYFFFYLYLNIKREYLMIVRKTQRLPAKVRNPLSTLLSNLEEKLLYLIPGLTCQATYSVFPSLPTSGILQGRPLGIALTAYWTLPC